MANAVDNFPACGTGSVDPLVNGIAVTPNDSNDLLYIGRGLYIGVTGDVVGILAKDSNPVTFKNCQAGSTLPWRFKRIYATGTTATNLILGY